MSWAGELILEFCSFNKFCKRLLSENLKLWLAFVVFFAAVGIAFLSAVKNGCFRVLIFFTLIKLVAKSTFLMILASRASLDIFHVENTLSVKSFFIRSIIRVRHSNILVLISSVLVIGLLIFS